MEKYRSNMDTSEKWYCINEWFMAFLLVPYFLLGPAAMLYVGFSSVYCMDIFSDWLICGGFLVYLDVGLFVATWRANKTWSYKKVENVCIYWTFIALSGLVIIWWVIGYSRIFAPGSKGGSNNRGMLDLELMQDPWCKAHHYDFPFWICISPFLFLGWYFISMIVYACLGG